MARKGDHHVDAPANVDIEAVVWSDPRFRMLAAKTGLDLFSVIARCARVWSACTDRSSCLMSADDIDLFAEMPDFASAMVKCRLAQLEEGGVYVSGTTGRVEWLQGCRERGSKGGQASARVRKERIASSSVSTQATGQPLAAPVGQASLPNSAPGAQANSTPGPGPDPGPGTDGEDPETNTCAPVGARGVGQVALISIPPTPRFDFGAVYAKYPRKRGKDAGLKACREQIRTQADFETLVRGVDAYLDEIRRLRTPADKQQHFSTFLNSGRWRELAEEATATPAPRKSLEQIMGERDRASGRIA
jgi:hypothetical protein